MKDIREEILKPGSIAGQVYFLLLGIPRTVSQISKYLYAGKVQLTHINRIINKLESGGYIEQIFNINNFYKIIFFYNDICI